MAFRPSLAIRFHEVRKGEMVERELCCNVQILQNTLEGILLGSSKKVMKLSSSSLIISDGYSNKNERTFVRR